MIANPTASGDIRRLVAEGRVIPAGEKVNIIRRVLLGLQSLGVQRVVAMPDPRLGERACAFVGLADGGALSFEDMVAHLRAHGMATQYFPEKLVIRDALPRTPSGKIQKFVLREEAKGFTAERR